MQQRDEEVAIVIGDFAGCSSQRAFIGVRTREGKVKRNFRWFEAI